MTINILMPALSPTMTEGKLAKWHVKEGEAVKSGQVICEIETDKATMEVEAVDEGTIGKILVAEGTEGVKVNAVIAVLLEEGESASAAGAAASAAPAPAPAAKPAAAQAPAAAARTAAAPAPAAAPKSAGARIVASPLAKRIAADAGVDLSKVSGSGPNGRIVKADVEAAMKGGAAKAAPAAAAAPVGAPKAAAPAAAPAGGRAAPTMVPHNAIRKVVARRLSEAKQVIPHIYLTVDVELDALLAARVAINAKGKAKVSVNDMIIKASAMALRDHPDINSSWSDEAMVQYNVVDVSVAVATDRGLITPIVKDADKKGLGAIATEMKDLAQRAKDGKLKLEEFQGGGFTISNLGMFGIKDFAGIINPPQSALLAVGAGEERIVARGGQPVVRTVMSVTLSADHRVIDGAAGAVFLQSLKGYLEQPATMLL